MSSEKDNLNIDEFALASYLEENIDQFKGPLSCTKFSDGQSNPTYKIVARSGGYVLRRQPPGELLKSAHAVDREYKVLKALEQTEVPVAKVYHLCTDLSVIGSMFYLMEYCDGRIFWDPLLPELDNGERHALYDEMNRVLALIHNVNLERVGLTDYGKPGNYFQRQLDRWIGQYDASKTRSISSINKLIVWLRNNVPHDDNKASLVHGDYRLDNFIFHRSEPRIIAILDWELSTIGNPISDLANQCMQLRLPQGFGNLSGLSGVDRQGRGIPTESEYLAAYCHRMNIGQIDHWAFYLAFAFFRSAAIAQGVAKRALDGNASNTRGADLAAYVEPLAEQALSVIKTLNKTKTIEEIL